jgi:hypothetical protein
MTPPAGAPIPVTVRVAEDVHIPPDALRDTVTAALSTRLRQLGLPGQAQVSVVRDGDGLQILAGSVLLGETDTADLAARPLPLVVQTCIAGESTPLATEPVIGLLWASARPQEYTAQQPPEWFARLVRAVVWAGGHVGDPGPLSDAVRTALAEEASGAAIDPDALAEQVMRRFIREITLAADDATLPRVFDLLRSEDPASAADDGSAADVVAGDATQPDETAQMPAFSRFMTEALGSLASVAPPPTFVADPEVPVGYVTVRLCGVDLGSLPVPGSDRAIACLPPAALENLDGLLGPVPTGLPKQSQAWSLMRVGSEADTKVREALHPLYRYHLAYGTAQFLGEHRHWLPSANAVGAILGALERSSPYGYSVWFARAILSDEQITSVLRILLFFGVPLDELPMALRDVLLIRREQLPVTDGTLMTGDLALATRDRYHRRSAGVAWDAPADITSTAPSASAVS